MVVGEPRSDLDQELRRRLRAWTRYFRDSNPFPSDRAMARKMEVAPPTLTNILNGKGTPGLDFAVKLARTFREKLDVLVDFDPPTVATPSVQTPGPEPAAGPASASSSPARPGRQKARGGH